MSLAIDIANVTQVLLADGWHEVLDSSFWLDSYELFAYDGPDDEGDPAHRGGDSGICDTGFRFTTTVEDDEVGPVYLSGPFTSVLALRHYRDQDLDG